MGLQAGFAEVDITPPMGTERIGWLRKIVAEEVLDPLAAHIAVFADGQTQIAFVQLDTLSIRWTQTEEIRRHVTEQYGFDGANVMVSATHNHAGPAVANCGLAARDDVYVESMVTRVVEAFGDALAGMEDVEIGFGRATELDVAHNRRIVMRDGTVKTHGRLDDPEALCAEGPVDPEVAVMAVRGKKHGEPLGAIINFACHPTHHGGEPIITAGYPGVLNSLMKQRGCPVTLFLNGACGNLSTNSLRKDGHSMTMEEAGTALRADVDEAISEMIFSSDVQLGAISRTIELPYREPTEEQIAGTALGAQRFIDGKIYDAKMDELIDRIRTHKTQPAEVQVLFVGDYAVVGIPAEYFVENGLRIKEETWPTRTLISSCTNGMVGYLPHQEAFERGGYETTFCGGSRMAPEAGDMLADAAIELIREGAG